MNEAFYIGATGMRAQQRNVDSIANNLANLDTIGFKKVRISFSDLIVHENARMAQPAGLDNEDIPAASMPFRLGAGVGISSIGKLFDAGELKKTGSPFDLAIQGDGFLEVMLPDGSRGYTRGGTLKVNQDRQLATQSGHPIKPGITIPEDAQALTITNDGRVQASIAGKDTPVEVGQLELARFTNPSMLAVGGDSLYRITVGSGEPIVGRPGDEIGGTFAQGVLESSNVRLIEEMFNLMVAQRAYEASAKVVQASDEISRMVNNLRS